MRRNIYLINDIENEQGARDFKQYIQGDDYNIVDKVVDSDVVAVLITDYTHKDPLVMQEINDAKFFRKPVVGFKTFAASVDSAKEVKKMGVTFVVKDAETVNAQRNVLDLVLKGKSKGYDLHWI